MNEHDDIVAVDPNQPKPSRLARRSIERNTWGQSCVRVLRRACWSAQQLWLWMLLEDCVALFLALSPIWSAGGRRNTRSSCFPVIAYSTPRRYSGLERRKTGRHLSVLDRSALSDAVYRQDDFGEFSGTVPTHSRISGPRVRNCRIVCR